MKPFNTKNPPTVLLLSLPLNQQEGLSFYYFTSNLGAHRLSTDDDSASLSNRHCILGQTWLVNTTRTTNKNQNASDTEIFSLANRLCIHLQIFVPSDYFTSSQWCPGSSPGRTHAMYSGWLLNVAALVRCQREASSLHVIPCLSYLQPSLSKINKAEMLMKLNPAEWIFE